MTVPIVDSLSRLQQDDTFVVVCRKRLQAMFFGMKNVETVTADFTGQRHGMRGVVSLYRELHRRYRIDAVIDLQDVLRTRLLSALLRIAGVPVYRIDYGRREKRRLRFRGWQQSKQLPTEFERYAQTFQKSGLKTDEHFRALPVNATAAAAVEERYGRKQGSWIGIAPFAKSKTNMLPYRITKEVMQHYAGLPDTRVWLFGAGEIECEILRQWASVLPNVVSVAGQLPLEEELELMRKLDVMLCMDSANQHLASIVGLRAVSVWCGTHPYTGFYGWNQRSEDRLEMPLSCRPCTNHGRNRCLYGNYLCKQFTAEEVIRKMDIETETTRTTETTNKNV